MDKAFVTRNLVDSLRTIYRHRAKNSADQYHTIEFLTRDNEIVFLPMSDNTLYDLYVAISKYAVMKFDKAITKDKKKLEQFNQVKSNDNYIETKVKEIKGKLTYTKLQKLYQKILGHLLPNVILLEEVLDADIKKFVMDTINNERYLFDIYYIKRYFELYDDIELNWDEILLDAINHNNKKVATITGTSYPTITEISDAQIYFYEVYNTTYEKHKKKWIIDQYDRLSRNYFRTNTNEIIKEYIENRHERKNNIHRLNRFLLYVISLCLWSILHLNFVVECIWLGCIVIGHGYIYTECIRGENHKFALQCIQYEDSILEPLTEIESKLIWDHIQIK